MTNLEHQHYLADLERSALNSPALPRLPGALIVILLLVGLIGTVASATFA